jgi:hypothetical protein
MASEEVRGSFCRYDSCVITDQLATGTGTLERELLLLLRPPHPDPLPAGAKGLVCNDMPGVVGNEQPFNDEKRKSRNRVCSAQPPVAEREW